MTAFFRATQLLHLNSDLRDSVFFNVDLDDTYIYIRSIWAWYKGQHTSSPPFACHLYSHLYSLVFLPFSISLSWQWKWNSSHNWETLINGSGTLICRAVRIVKIRSENMPLNTLRRASLNVLDIVRRNRPRDWS